MGGMVAFEMAHQLRAAGEEVAFLTLTDTPCGNQMPPREDHSAAIAALFRDLTGTALDLATLRRLERQERIPYAIDQLGKDPGRVDAEQLARQAVVMEHNAKAIHRYTPRPELVRLLFFRAAERRPGDPLRPELPWIELARSGTEVVVTPGNHMSMHTSPHLETMAERLQETLNERQRQALCQGPSR
jgi:thioesterase domain-containing protein